MNIGLIAHDSKKILMQNFCIAYGYDRKTGRRSYKFEYS